MEKLTSVWQLSPSPLLHPRAREPKQIVLTTFIEEKGKKKGICVSEGIFQRYHQGKHR